MGRHRLREQDAVGRTMERAPIGSPVESDSGGAAFAELTEIYRIDADFKIGVGRVRRHDRARRPRAGRNFRLTPFRMCSGLRLPVRWE
jgi:hypothetical protein